MDHHYDRDDFTDLLSRCFSGKMPLGHDFAELYKEEKWKTQIMDPFGKFAEMVYRMLVVIEL